MRKTNVEYEALLERLLTQETSFFRYPAVYDTFEKRVLPELHVKKFWKNREPCAFGAPAAPPAKSPTPSPSPSPTHFPSPTRGMSKFWLPM